MGIREVPQNFFEGPYNELPNEKHLIAGPHARYGISARQYLTPEESRGEHDADSAVSTSSEASSTRRPVTVIDVDHTSDGIRISFPSMSDDHIIVHESRRAK